VKRVVVFVAAAEAATGVLLLVDPNIVVRLVFGTGIAAAGAAMSRIAGVLLIALGIACWPAGAAETRSAVRGLIVYSLLAALVLAFVGIGGPLTGPLLWPAVALHGILMVLLLRVPLEKAGMEEKRS
jgi:hypothetical protein